MCQHSPYQRQERYVEPEHGHDADITAGPAVVHTSDSGVSQTKKRYVSLFGSIVKETRQSTNSAHRPAPVPEHQLQSAAIGVQKRPRLPVSRQPVEGAIR